MLDFIFQAVMDVPQEVVACTERQTCRELLSSVQTPVSSWWLWRQIQAAEADKPRVPPPPSSHRGFPFNPEMFTASLNLFYMFLFQPCSRVPPRALPASRFAVFPTTFLFPAPQIRHIPPSTGKNCLLFVAE